MTNPATPGAQAPATPGNGAQPDLNQPPTNPPAPPAAPGGKVEIPTEEYARLQRNEARLKALQRRDHRPPRGPVGTGTNDPTANPDDPANEALARERQARQDLEQKLLERDVKDGVRDLLAKPEFADLPESTKKLILRNPSAYSNARTAEEAVQDIEDFLLDEVTTTVPKPAGQQPGTQPQQQQRQPSGSPAGHETPPTVSAGSPSGAPAERLEDLNRLSGAERSRAALRNVFKKSRGVQE